MKVQAVLPSIYQKWTDRCAATMCTELWSSTLFLDNTHVNRGVAASWNEGINAMFTNDADGLLILSATMRFGYRGGSDFLELLPSYADAIAVEAGHGIGFHCIYFPRWVFELVGTFDENYWPGYHEDLDLSRRIKLAIPEIEPPYWVKVTDLDMSMAGFSHGIDLGLAQVDNHELAGYYQRKWGGIKGLETFEHPFDDPEHDWTWWPRPPDLRALNHAGWRS